MIGGVEPYVAEPGFENAESAGDSARVMLQKKGNSRRLAVMVIKQGVGDSIRPDIQFGIRELRSSEAYRKPVGTCGDLLSNNSTRVY